MGNVLVFDMIPETLVGMDMLVEERRAIPVPDWFSEEDLDDLKGIVSAAIAAREPRCTCHERDGSVVCDHCYSQGFRGHMQE